MSLKSNPQIAESLATDMDSIMNSAGHKALFIKEADLKDFKYNPSGNKGNKIEPAKPAPVSPDGYKHAAENVSFVKPVTSSEILSDLVKIADYLGNVGLITSEAMADTLINSIIVEAAKKEKKAKKVAKKAKKAAKKERKMKKLEEKVEKKEEKIEKECPEGDPTCE